jgi:hypothetical protein
MAALADVVNGVDGGLIIVAPSAIRLARRLEASCGESVRVSGGSVVTCEVRVIVTVTRDRDVAVDGDVLLPFVPRPSLESLILVFVLPKMPPVAPVASIAEMAPFSLVQERIVPALLVSGTAKQFWVFAQRPRVISQFPFPQAAMAPLMHALSPSAQGSDEFKDWKRAFSL